MPIKFDFAWRLQSVSSGFLECCIRKDSEVVPEIPVKAAIAHSCCSPLALIHVTLIYAVNNSITGIQSETLCIKGRGITLEAHKKYILKVQEEREITSN